MKNSIEIFKQLSSDCYTHYNYYTFNKLTDEPEKYRKGRIVAANWINEVLYMFMNKDKELINDFISILDMKKEELNHLNNGNYKQGLLDEINEIKELINDKYSK